MDVELKKIYKHIDTDDSSITLHDCYANRITVEKGKISFDFEEGFWITPDHKSSNLQETVRTDSSRVDFYMTEGGLEDITIFVFQKNIFRNTIREKWTIQELINLVNDGVFRLEFIGQFKSYNEILWECRLDFDKAPYSYECQMKIPTTKVIYRWNNLRPKRVW